MSGYDKQIVQNDHDRWQHEACDESGFPVANVPEPEHYRDPVKKNFIPLKEIVKGVSPAADTVVNDRGGKQSRTLYRCDLLPAKATLHVAEILEQGAKKYGPNNWRNIPCEDHLNHALVHAFAFLAGDETDDHLGHFACRALMALEMK